VQNALVFLSLCIMFYAYVIRSISTGYLYKGHCENLEERLKQHNSGMTESIKMYIPFEVVYFECFDTREEAIKREKYFKSATGRRFLKNKLSQ
jgi:putative endonuclease